LFAQAIARLGRAYRHWPRGIIPRHFRIHLTTGPLFITSVARHAKAPADLYIVPEHLLAEYIERIEGKTWYGRDTHFFLFIHRCLAAIGVPGF
jgi:hypothetical protein